MSDNEIHDAEIVTGTDLVDPSTNSSRYIGKDAKGRFIRTPEGIARDAEALRLRSRGQTLQAISNQLGYGSPRNVIKATKRATQDIQGEAAAEYVQQQLDRIAMLRREAITILEKDHLVVSHGHVVTRMVSAPVPCGDERCPGESCTACVPPVFVPLLDDGPKLAAMDRLRQLDERESRLLGLDAPQKVDATVHQVDPADLELMDLINSQRAKNAAERARIQEQG